MRIGFTGSQHGMSAAQAVSFARVLSDLIAESGDSMHTFHHGCCVGADVDAHRVVVAHYPTVIPVGHPASDVGTFKVATSTLDRFGKLYAPRPAMERNSIIAKVGPLIATPATFNEMRRSGTWATVRRSRAYGQYPRYLIHPDGSVVEEK